jgi:hypothetical protein
MHYIIKYALHAHAYLTTIRPSNPRGTGDPHPGNLLLMPSGKLGLIDYGQIKELKPGQRRSLARMIVALADGKTQEVIDLFVQMGFRSQVRRHGWSIEPRQGREAHTCTNAC